MTRLMRVRMIQTTFLKTNLLLTKKRAKWLQSLAWLANETRCSSKTTHQCRPCKNQAINNRGWAERQLITKQTKKTWSSGEVKMGTKRVIPRSIKTLDQSGFTESKRLCRLASSPKTERCKGPIVGSTTTRQKAWWLPLLTPRSLSLRNKDKCKNSSLTCNGSLPISSPYLKMKTIRRTITRMMKNFDQFLHKTKPE